MARGTAAARTARCVRRRRSWEEAHRGSAEGSSHDAPLELSTLQLVRCELAFLIGHLTAPATQARLCKAELASARVCLSILASGGLLPVPMRHAPQLFGTLSAQETGSLLHGIWQGLQVASWAPAAAASEAARQPYKKAVKVVLASRVTQLGHAYGHFIGAAP